MLLPLGLTAATSAIDQEPTHKKKIVRHIIRICKKLEICGITETVTNEVK